VVFDDGSMAAKDSNSQGPPEAARIVVPGSEVRPGDMRVVRIPGAMESERVLDAGDPAIEAVAQILCRRSMAGRPPS
jgi:hypothetical protein